MLGKLLKHELRATSRTMLPILGLMLLISVLANLGLRGMNGQSLPAVLTVICVIILILFSVGVFAVGLVTVFVMVQRFRNNLLRDEGYIMHTLPVSIHSHIWAKVIVSGIWYIAVTVVLVLSMLIVAADVEMVDTIINVSGQLLKAMGEIRNVEIVTEILTLTVLGNIFFSLMLYASLAVGHAFPAKKMLLSAATFIVLIVGMELITSGIVSLINLTGLSYDMSGEQFMDGWRAVCAMGAGYLVFFSAAFYGITVWFMKRKLNLE